MAVTLNGVLETGVRALRTSQAGLSTTGHNISNVNTEGYTRQRVVQETTFPIDFRPGDFGTGVTIAEVIRMKVAFFDNTIQAVNGELGEAELFYDTLRTLQTFMGDPTSGSVGGALNEFFNRLHDLAGSPEEIGIRQAVVDQGVVLANTFQDLINRINRLNDGLNAQLTADVAQVNSKTEEIFNLNRQIHAAELNGNNANDLRDRRDLLVEELSRFMELTVEEVAEGFIIEVDGDILVDEFGFELLEAVDNGTGHLEVEFSSGGFVTAITGRFEGYIQSFQRLDDLTDDLNDLAEIIIDEVNIIHGGGFDLDGLGGEDFFDGLDATDIEVNQDIIDDPRLVAASESGAPGNGAIALELAQLSNQQLAPSSNPLNTLNDFFGSLVVNLGTQAQLSQSRFDDNQRALELVLEERASVSGVNMDEEVSNMLRYQHAFNAASRIITTIDDAMDRVINRMGRVGIA